jgi:lipid A 3-O-deacylase
MDDSTHGRPRMPRRAGLRRASRPIAVRPRRGRVVRALLAATASAAIAAIETASAAPPNDFAGFVQAGEGDRAVKSVAFGATATFTAQDPANPGPWSVYGEAVVGEWFAHHRDPGQPRSVTQFTVAPVLRYTVAGGAFHDVFIEAGVGLSVITPHFQDHGRTFSTTFNFDDHASLGKRFGTRREYEWSVRVEHFSNGGIRNPNPGQNFAQVRLARHF